jgi:glycerophosphoryl diester phosphodiesterase
MWSYPKIIAHRGGGILAPENTLAAMQCAVTYSMQAVEFDVMLSKDGIPIAMHDPVLGRTIAGEGKVSDLTAQELTALDAGSWFGKEYEGEYVPTFEEVAQFCKANQLWMDIEIKPAPGFEQATGYAVAALTRRIFQSELAMHIVGVNDALLPIFSSFSMDALLAAKDAAPDIPRAYLVDIVPPDWHQQLNLLDATGLYTNHKHLTLEQTQAIKQTGFGLLCYTVNDPMRVRELFSWGVDAICTDRIDLIGADFF